MGKRSTLLVIFIAVVGHGVSGLVMVVISFGLVILVLWIMGNTICPAKYISVYNMF